MTKAERKYLADWVRTAANAMELKDWYFDIVYEEPTSRDKDREDDQQWGLTFEQTRHRKHATITVPPDVKDRYPEEELRQGLTHELVHAHFAPMWDLVRVDLRELDLTEIAYDLFIAGFERQMEYGVDAMAYALAPHMPKFKWPESS